MSSSSTSKAPPRFSRAPPGFTPYTDDDFDPNTGALRRLREIPLGNYAQGVQTQITSYSETQYDAPPDPLKPPEVKPRKLETNKPPVQKAATATEDPEPFKSEEHHIAVVSYIENRNPMEDEVLKHYVRQQEAIRAGTYDPLEDPPVDLRQITPTLCVKVSRTFHKKDTEHNNGDAVRNYVERLHAATDWNVLALECGKAQPLPVSDYVRGIYKDPTLQQQMDAFYNRLEKSKSGILERVGRDATEGKSAHDASKAATDAELSNKK
jgi:hypothetical protein